MDLLKTTIRFWGYTGLVLMVPFNLFLGVLLYGQINSYSYMKSKYEVTVENAAQQFAESFRKDMRSRSIQMNNEYTFYKNQNVLLEDSQDEILKTLKEHQTILEEQKKIYRENVRFTAQNEMLYEELLKLEERFNKMKR